MFITLFFGGINMQTEVNNLINELNSKLAEHGFTAKIKLKEKKPKAYFHKKFELTCLFQRLNRKAKPVSESDKMYVNFNERFSLPVFNVSELGNTDGLSVQKRINDKRFDVAFRYAKRGYKLVNWSIIERN